MRYQISEILEDFQEEMPWEAGKTPLSMDNIRSRTLDRVKEPVPRRRGRGKLRRLLLAAAMVSLLTITAAAAEESWGIRDWFREALSRQARENAAFAEKWELDSRYRDYVGEDQLALLEEHGKVQNQSVARHGATMTLAALYGDEYVLNLYLRVEAPEGTVLPDGVQYRFEDPLSGSGGAAGTVGVPEGYALGEAYNPILQALPDDDPQDNRKDFVFQLTHYPAVQRVNGVPQTKWTFTDAVPKTFTAKGLFAKTEDGQWERLLFGDFRFDITNAHAVERLEIPVEGLNYGGHVEYEWSLPGGTAEAVTFDYTVEPISLTLSPFSMVTECRYTCTDPSRARTLQAEIILKDGTSIRSWELAGREGESGYLREVYAFSTPLAVEEIDHIRIGEPENSETYLVFP